jgi:hypothetical protein
MIFALHRKSCHFLKTTKIHSRRSYAVVLFVQTRLSCTAALALFESLLVEPRPEFSGKFSRCFG